MSTNPTPAQIAEVVAAGSGLDNALDVQVEIAMFVPDDEFVAIRANAAGTKVIYTRADGSEVTHWSEDWTMDRPGTAAALRNHLAQRSEA